MCPITALSKTLPAFVRTRGVQRYNIPGMLEKKDFDAMAFESLSPEVDLTEEQPQLGAPMGVYTQHVTLSGKVLFAAMLLLALFIVIDVFLLFWGAISIHIVTPLAFIHGFIAVASLIAVTKHEEAITPWQTKLSVSVYSEGLIYRKGRHSWVVLWDDIHSIQRQTRVYRRKKKIIHMSSTYICKTAQKPKIVLSPSFGDIAKVGALIEHKLTQRLLPQVQADYQAGKEVAFFTFSLTQQSIKHSRKEADWTNVGRIDVGPETLVVKNADHQSDLLTISLKYVPNICVLEALLEYIHAKQGFELSLAMSEKTQYSESSQVSDLPRNRSQPKKPTWISTLVLTLCCISALGLEAWAASDALNSEQLGELPSQTFQVAGPPTLIIKADAVDHLYITNQAKDSNKVYLYGWKESTGFSRLNDIQQHATQSGDTITLSWTMQQRAFLGIGSEKVDLYITVPVNTNVQIETRTGEINIGYLRGEIKVKSQSSSIDVQADLQGRSQLLSTFGKIDFCGTLNPYSNDLFQSGNSTINITLPSDAAFRAHQAA